TLHQLPPAKSPHARQNIHSQTLRGSRVPLHSPPRNTPRPAQTPCRFPQRSPAKSQRFRSPRSSLTASFIAFATKAPFWIVRNCETEPGAAVSRRLTHLHP